MTDAAIGEWAVLEVEAASGVAIFRLRLNRPPDAAEHPTSMMISWPYAGDERGFPAPSALQAMDAFESAIDDLTAQPGLSYLLCVITGFNAREYHFYTSSRDRFLTAFNAALRQHPPLPLRIHNTDDPGWDIWQKIRDRAGGADPRPLH
jgi:Family of unknown function (DUF695)